MDGARAGAGRFEKTNRILGRREGWGHPRPNYGDSQSHFRTLIRTMGYQTRMTLEAARDGHGFTRMRGVLTKRSQSTARAGAGRKPLAGRGSGSRGPAAPRRITETPNPIFGHPLTTTPRVPTRRKCCPEKRVNDSEGDGRWSGGVRCFRTRTGAQKEYSIFKDRWREPLARPASDSDIPCRV